VDEARQAGRARAAAGLMPALAALLLALWAAGLGTLPERLDELAFDAQLRLARAWRDPAAGAPAPLVVVGIDDDSLDALGVPLALLHATLGRVLQDIAQAQPLAIGVDLALPARSYEALAPGAERELLRGLLAARQGAGLVLALDADAQGRLRLPPLATVATAGGTAAFGLPLFPLDCDGVVRRFEPDPGFAAPGAGCGAPALAMPAARDLQPGPGTGRSAAAGAGPQRAPADAPVTAPDTASAGPRLPTFVARLAERLGRGERLRQAAWIDYTRGLPFTYLPLRQVAAWGRQHDRAALRARFEGKVVLLGSVLPYLDRLRLPLPLAAWEPASTLAPGLLVNAQVLRGVLGEGLLRPAGATAALAWLCALVALAWVGSSAWRWGLWLMALVLALAGGALLQSAGVFLAPSQGLLAGAGAVLLRTLADLRAERQARTLLTQRLGAALGPQALRALLQRPRGGAPARRAVAVMFADLRDFTAWSEHADPAQVLDTLNRYYAALAPVLQAHGGRIDQYRGDGILVLFGALEALEQPCAAALAAAAELLALLEDFNAGQAARGLAPLGVRIGLAYGEVLLGELGSAAQRELTALGDAVNVAARLQELAGVLGHAALLTQAAAERLAPDTPGLRALGPQALKGHTPVAVVAWDPPAHVASATPHPSP
jgi:class 3 adenylate cyclase